MSPTSNSWREVFARDDEPMRVAGWLPLHHDMGLVGHLLTVLHARGMGVFLPPAAFLARPSLWLDAVHRYRAYLSGAPTFAFEHCVRKAEPDPAWDLSCWKFVFVGSETVSLPVLDRFLNRFSRSGVRPGVLRPVFGLAEATLLAAGGSKGLDALRPRVERLPSGRQLPPFTLEEGVSIQVRDPEIRRAAARGGDRRDLGERRVGQPGLLRRNGKTAAAWACRRATWATSATAAFTSPVAGKRWW